MTEYPVLDDFPVELHKHIEALLDHYGSKSAYRASFLVEALHFLEGKSDAVADMKMTTSVLHEIRLGLDCFEHYQAWRKVSFFGSARTKPDDPCYQQTMKCAEAMREAGFMVITGGGGG